MSRGGWVIRHFCEKLRGKNYPNGLRVGESQNTEDLKIIQLRRRQVCKSKPPFLEKNYIGKGRLMKGVWQK